MLIPESCKNSIAHPCVVEKNGFYYLYFCGTSALPSSLQGGAENFRIFRYKSIDLLNWTPVDYETSYHGDSEIIYMNTCGDLEYTTEVQNQQFYPLACATNKEIKILLPYLKGENILLNPCFDADVNNWEIGNENWAESSIYTGTMVKNLDSTITQIGFNNSCKLTSTGQRTRSCIKQTSSLECEIGDYIANIAYVNNNSCRKVILTTDILDMDNNIILSYDNTVTGNNGWIPIVNILKVPSKKTDGSMYFGRYKVRTQVCVDIDDGQSLNVSNIQVFKINRALLS